MNISNCIGCHKINYLQYVCYVIFKYDKLINTCTNNRINSWKCKGIKYWLCKKFFINEAQHVAQLIMYLNKSILGRGWLLLRTIQVLAVFSGDCWLEHFPLNPYSVWFWLFDHQSRKIYTIKNLWNKKENNLLTWL